MTWLEWAEFRDSLRREIAMFRQYASNPYTHHHEASAALQHALIAEARLDLSGLYVSRLSQVPRI
jgi:hypothetical protein